MITNIITQRLKLQSTIRALEVKFKFPIIKEIKLKNLQSFYNNIPDNRKKDFLCLVGGKANLTETQSLFK